MVTTHKKTTLKIWSLIGKAILLLVIYAFFLYFAVSSIFKLVEHRRLANELASEDKSYEKLFEQYSRALLEAEKLEGDKDYQRKVLKESNLYLEKDEEQIVIYEE